MCFTIKCFTMLMFATQEEERDASTCVRGHQALALTPREGETLPRV